jgi:hypothetical protein
MSEIINFVNYKKSHDCDTCRYCDRSNGSCSNEKYLAHMYEVCVARLCKYWKAMNKDIK